MELRFVNVSFTYAGNNKTADLESEEVSVLHGVSFTVAPLTLTAIVGRSGAGKSTLFRLIQKFYAPSQGSIVCIFFRIILFYYVRIKVVVKLAGIQIHIIGNPGVCFLSDD